MFITDNFPSFYFNLLVSPFAITPAFHTALVRAALSAGIETAHTVFIQAIAQIQSTGYEDTSTVVHFVL